MAPFDFKSDKHFVASSDKLTLHIYELISKNAIANPSSIRKNHWSEVAVIVPRRDNLVDDNDDDDDEANEYNGLVFFDGYGEILEPTALTKLAQELTRLRLIVSPEGYCYQDVTEFGSLKDFGIHYLRLNDLFDWSLHGVDLATTTVWRRSKLRYQVPKHEKQTKQAGGGVSKEKYEELKMLIKEKEDQLEKVNEEKNEAERLREDAEEELQRLKDDNDKELRKLRKERDRTVQKKDDELQRLKKELQKKDEELQKLTKDKELDNNDADDNGDATRVIIEKLREENEEQLREMEKFKSQSLTREADLKDRLENCSKKSCSWSRTPTVKLFEPIGWVPEAKQYHLASRRPVPPETFIVHDECDSSPDSYRTVEIIRTEWYKIVDDDQENILLWPAPPKVCIATSDGKMDTSNWWFAKTSAPEGGLTMVAYYDGDFNSVTVSRHGSISVRVPYSKGAAFCPGRIFVLASMGPAVEGLRLAFVYRF